MSHTLAPADVSHYYQRLAELSTLPFWQREEFTEPTGPERGHVWHWQDVYPELARSRQFAADAAGLQRRALILCNPGLTAAGGRCHPDDRGGLPDALPRREGPRPRPFHLRRTVRARGQRRPHDHRRGPGADGTGRPHPHARLELARPRPSRRRRARGVDGRPRRPVRAGPAGRLHPRRPVLRRPAARPGHHGNRRRNRRAAPGRHAARTAQPGPPLPVGPGLPGPAAADGPVPRAQHPHQPGVPQPAHRRPRPGHPGLPAPGPARRRPDPAAPGNRQLGHRGGPRHRDAGLRRPDLPARCRTTWRPSQPGPGTS